LNREKTSEDGQQQLRVKISAIQFSCASIGILSQGGNFSEAESQSSISDFWGLRSLMAFRLVSAPV
jgi:hypothetical protein